VNVVLGYSERAGGSLYMGQVFISRGSATSTRRKLKPTHVERSVFGEGDGSDLVVHGTAAGPVGALYCWEHLQPLSKYAMYSLGSKFCRGLAVVLGLPGATYSLGPEVNVTASTLCAKIW
jgi:nitrilase